MRGNHTWYIVRLTDGTDQHAHASHIGFDSDGLAGGEVIFYGDAAGSRVDMRLPVKAVERIQAVSLADGQNGDQ